ncbi:MAG: glycine--tRNA ligase subunit beta [Gracilibacteraceae bacterium]|jgi:glycyl-tRNA synthetase beta chain|nr:glycine--tRNA ligase subunit beta [Gracilibacteraceae bacterium]
MSRDFLLEIGMEEMPAKFAPDAARQLKENALARLAALRLDFAAVTVYVTPRRLALLVSALAERQADTREETRGPARKAAYDEAGQPTKAALGFAAGQGVRPEDLFVRDFKNIPYVYASRFQAGAAAAELLPAFCAEIIAGLRFPKPMRWGDGDARFARPLRWLVALYGAEILPLSYAGLTAGRLSRGHRVLGGEVTVPAAGDYARVLAESGFVLAERERRRETIRSQVDQTAAALAPGAAADITEALLDEVTDLVEYPTAFWGRIPAEFMTLPEEATTTPMREHQRYFPTRAAGGALLPYFIGVRNGDARSLDTVRAGNEKVLRARLADAAFYFHEDLKKPLADYVPELDRVTYHERLGSAGARVKRLRRLTAALAAEFALDPLQAERADRTALLAKADLVTRMVYDFPELQGIMGAHYAKAAGEEDEVCAGIREHYQPRFSGDALPVSRPGVLVSLADKLDAVTGCFALGLIPTGSQDPYALRRQALGVAAILAREPADLDLGVLLAAAYDGLPRQESGQLAPWAEIEEPLREFFRQRLRFLLMENGWTYDAADCVLAANASRPYAATARAAALARARTEDGFTDFVNAYTRCLNLSGPAGQTAAGPTDAAADELLTEPAERALLAALAAVASPVAADAAAGDFYGAYSRAAALVAPVAALFDSVMIMAPEAALRAARLALLGRCVRTLGVLGDLTLLAPAPLKREQ